MTETLLVLNAGSSSIKFQLFGVLPGDGLELKLKGQMDGIGTRPRLRVRDDRGDVLVDSTYTATEVPDVAEATRRAGGWLRQQYAAARLVAVGHRVAHGGPVFTAPVCVDEGVLKVLERFIPLAPLHQQYQIGAMGTLAALGGALRSGGDAAATDSASNGQ